MCLLYAFFGKLYLNLLSIFKLGCLFTAELKEFFMYFGYKSLFRDMICKYSLLFHSMFFHFLRSTSLNLGKV